MPAIILVRLEALSEPADDVVNTYHIDGPPPFDDRQALADAVDDLYAELGTGTGSNPAFGGSLSGNGEVRIYDFADPKPRVPLITHQFAFGTSTSGSALPPQVAAAVTFRGPQASGQPPARRRGRAFLGHINASKLSFGDNRIQFTEAFMGQCVDAFENFALAVQQVGTPGDYDFAIYSRVDNAFRRVANITMTSGPDVIRSRKTRSTRTPVSVDIPASGPP